MNSTMKRALALILGILLAALPASGLTAAVPAAPNTVFPLPADPADNVLIHGSISKTAIGNYLLTNSDTSAPYTEIELIVMEDSLTADCATGRPLAPEDMVDGSLAYAYINASSTQDLPPAAILRVLLCNIPENGTVPAYLELRRAINPADSSKIQWVTDKELAIGFTADTILEALDAAQMTLETADTGRLRPGVRILAWYTEPAPGMPAEAGADKAVLLPYGYYGYVELGAGGRLYVNGSPLALDAKTAVYQNAGGFTMFPLRKVYEALGYTVTWDSANAFIILSYAGEKEFGFVFDMNHADAMAELGGVIGESATDIDVMDGVTFVSAADLTRLSNVMFSHRL